jgi:hypothetical protein
MGHRTALLTAGSIALVVFAGTVAAGANLGILNAADSRPFGTLSAAGEVATSGPEVVRVYVSEPAPAEPQQYVIEKVGTVSVAATTRTLRLAEVTTKPGWRWTLMQTADRKLRVTFESATTTYTFLAALGRDGVTVARVEKPVTRLVTTVSSSSGTGGVAPAATATPPAVSDGEAADEGGEDDGGEGDDEGGEDD